MILNEISSISSGALPFYNFKNHLRMGTGFDESDLQDPLIEAYLRAAISTIENKLGLVLLQREFQLNLTGWRDGQSQVFPTRPVQSISSVTINAADGSQDLVSTEAYRLRKDAQVPAIQAVGSGLPNIPVGGAADIIFAAGYGVVWDDLPADLAQAVLLLAAYFYENRIGAPLPSGVLPMAVLSLIDSYRPMRISGALR